MHRTHESGTPQVDTFELHRVLEAIFGLPIISLRRSPFAYSSSYAIEKLQIAFRDGTDITIIFKNVGPNGILTEAHSAKPVFLYDPQREIQVYRSILSSINLGTPRLYGDVVEPVAGRYWLFIEKVAALVLYEVGEFEVWLEVARWLARFHSSAICESGRAQNAVPQLIKYDAASYSMWFQRAEALLGSKVDHLTKRYQRIIDILLALPRTLIHGEFYPSNILVEQSRTGLRICPVDWEMAAVGPGILDVAALASGSWNREHRLLIAESYFSELPDSLRPGDFITAFDCCQLQLALQWLGWSETWVPPQEHAHDWLSEALELFARID
jgi:Phosphotransferase enzyme family